MPESEIPTVFRAALDDVARGAGDVPALEGPAPPPPVDPEPEDDGDGHHCVHLALIVFSDGAVHTASWASSLLLGWIWVATAVTSWTIARAALAYLPLMAIYGVLAVGMVVFWIVLGAIAEVERQRLAAWWQRRRATKGSVRP